MISIIFIILASICNAIMDITSFHFSISIFNKLNPGVWWPTISWKNKYEDFDPKIGRAKWGKVLVPVQITDAWHFFKMLLIIFICTSIVTYDFEFIIMLNTAIGLAIPLKLVWIEALGIYGTLWNVTFSLFYDKILRR